MSLSPDISLLPRLTFATEPTSLTTQRSSSLMEYRQSFALRSDPNKIFSDLIHRRTMPSVLQGPMPTALLSVPNLFETLCRRLILLQSSAILPKVTHLIPENIAYVPEAPEYPVYRRAHLVVPRRWAVPGLLHMLPYFSCPLSSG